MPRSPALEPPPGNPRFPLLDSMRAIAALCIVLTHTAAVSGFNTDNALGAYTARLNFGVAIFFVLSGFLLYRPFVAARLEGRPPIRVRDFIRRRVLRIVPAYWVALTLLGIYPGLLGLFGPDTWRYYTFTQNLTERTTVRGIGPAWTLAIEMSFYVALPFLAWAIGRIARRRVSREVAAIAALGLASLGLRIGLEAAGGSYVAQNTLACYFDWFAAGMLLAVLSVVTHGRERESRVLTGVVRFPWAPWALAALAFWFMSTQLGLPRGFFLVYTLKAYAGEHILSILAAALLVLPAVVGDWAGGWPRALLANRLLAWIGLISYGIFLWHAPIVLELHARGADDWLPGSNYLWFTLIVLVVSGACATASYYLVERPLLRFKDPRRGSRTASRRSAASASAELAATVPSADHAAALSGSSRTASRASGSA